MMKKIMFVLLILFITGCDRVNVCSFVIKQKECIDGSPNMKLKCVELVQEVAHRNHFRDMTESTYAIGYIPDVVSENKQTCKMINLFVLRHPNTSRWINIGQFDYQDSLIVEIKGWGLPREFSNIKNQLNEELTELGVRTN